MDVILPLAVPLYTYLVPNHLQNAVAIGCRVVVQLGTRKMYTAIVYAIHNNKHNTPTVKAIDSVLDEIPIVTQTQLQLWDWMADYYM
ncbi:MAG: primosomal protein N', partial [Bacteroidales bacterium]|nr:primosomal protein N' [Bacteroidales bacterium]